MDKLEIEREREGRELKREREGRELKREREGRELKREREPLSHLTSLRCIKIHVI